MTSTGPPAGYSKRTGRAEVGTEGVTALVVPTEPAEVPAEVVDTVTAGVVF
jgi:hypothetical protein